MLEFINAESLFEGKEFYYKQNFQFSNFYYLKNINKILIKKPNGQ